MAEEHLNQLNADIRRDGARWADWNIGFTTGIGCAADFLADYADKFETEKDRALFMEIIGHTKAIEPLILD